MARLILRVCVRCDESFQRADQVRASDPVEPQNADGFRPRPNDERTNLHLLWPDRGTV